jgi:hypothetical protein
MPFRLLEEFQRVFEGRIYRHRSSTQGDRLARFFYEDLYLLDRSPGFRRRVDELESIITTTNRVTGISGRRGDGTLGESLPTVQAIKEEGFNVGIGPTANIQIGVEVKILAKAMIKQIDRVANDLRHQASQFRNRNSSVVTIALVGVNHAARYESYEGDRVFVAEGSRSPAAEAPKAIRRLHDGAREQYDEFVVLPFQATNASPFPFEWINLASIEDHYSAALLRTLRLYEARFR